MKKAGKFAFIGNSFGLYILIVLGYIMLLLVEKFFNYQFLIVQKTVQSGALENWERFLTLLLISTVAPIVSTIYAGFIQLWTEKTTKFNLFEYYESIFQIRKLPIFLVYRMAWAKILLFQAVVATTLNIIYSFLIMDIVEMTVPQYIGAVMILAVGVTFGIQRGKLQHKTDKILSEITVRQNILTEHFMPSSSILVDRLHSINKMYSRRAIAQVLRKFFEYFPQIIKAGIFLILMWGIVGSMANENVYGYSYIVLTAYGFVFEIAVSIGDLIEQITSIKSYKNDEDVKELDMFFKKEKEIELSEAQNIKLSNTGLEISKAFTAPVLQATGLRFYKPSTPLKAKPGEITLLEAQNGVGKSRFLQLIKAVLSENCFLYDKQTWLLLPNVSENFISKNYEFDIDLLRMLVEGLNLDRVPTTNTEFKEYSLNLNPNGADGQLMVLLQILYFALKEHEATPLKNQIIILDEVFANISPENAKKTIAFVAKMIKTIQCPCIIVSHVHKDIIAPYVSTIWKMSNNEKTEYIDIE